MAGPSGLGHAPARILPFAAYLLFLLIAEVLVRLGADAMDLRWLYGVKITAVLALLWLGRHRYAELAGRAVDAHTLASSAAIGLGVFVLWINLDLPWMQMGQADGFDPRNHGAIDWQLALLRLAGAALVVPVMEELFWRSFMLRWLASPDFLKVRPAHVGMRALVITALLFGVEHNLWLAGIVAGLVYSLLYMRTGSLWAPIVAHAVTNGALGVWVLATGNWQFW